MYFTLGAFAPISGAYYLFDIEWPGALDGAVRPDAATYYLAHVTVAWNAIYRWSVPRTPTTSPAQPGGRRYRSGCTPHPATLHGADLTLTDVGDVDHITSLVLSMPHVATWFASMR